MSDPMTSFIVDSLDTDKLRNSWSKLNPKEEGLVKGALTIFPGKGGHRAAEHVVLGLFGDGPVGGSGDQLHKAIKATDQPSFCRLIVEFLGDRDK